MGLLGHQRRIADPSTLYSLGNIKELHLLSTIGAVGLLLFQIPFLVNFFGSLFFGKKADRNPWKSNTFEWSADSPPPHGNWPVLPDCYRSPYEYSVPGRASDYWPQNEPN